MKLVSKEVEEVVTATMRKVTGVQCDICNRILRHSEDSHPGHKYPKYYEVTTGHHDWGNDSCDSIKHRDICPNCIGEFVSQYLKTHNGTAYIDVETAYFSPEKVDADEWDATYGDYRFDEEGDPNV